MGEGKKVVLKPQAGRLSSHGKVALQARVQPVEQPVQERRCSLRKSAAALAASAAAADTKRASSTTSTAEYVNAGDSGGSSSSRAVVLHPGRPRTGVQLRPNTDRVAINGSKAWEEDPISSDWKLGATTRRSTSPQSSLSCSSEAMGSTPPIGRRVCLAPAKEPVAAKATVAAALAASAAAAAAPTASLRVTGKAKPRELGRKVTLVRRASLVAASTTSVEQDVPSPRRGVRLIKRRKIIAPPSVKAAAASAADSVKLLEGKAPMERVVPRRSALETRLSDDSPSVEAVEPEPTQHEVESFEQAPEVLPQEPPRARKRKSARIASREEPHRRRRRTSTRDTVETTGSLPSSQPHTPESATMPSLAATSQPVSLAEACQELTESDRAKLREKVHSHLHQICGDDNNAQIVADFVNFLVEARKSREEMVAELTFFKDGAEEFVDWVHKRVRDLVSRRRINGTVSGNDLRNHGAEQRLNLVSKEVDTTDEEINEKELALALSRNQKSVSQSDAIDLTKERPQPTDSIHQRKELLAKMTHEQKVILSRLSSKGLSDSEREKYQNLAKTLQAKIRSLNLGEKKRT